VRELVLYAIAAVGIALFCSVCVSTYPQLRAKLGVEKTSPEVMRRAQRFTLLLLLVATEGPLLIYVIARELRG
jgi:hypothetical protein